MLRASSELEFVFFFLILQASKVVVDATAAAPKAPACLGQKEETAWVTFQRLSERDGCLHVGCYVCVENSRVFMRLVSGASVVFIRLNILTAGRSLKIPPDFEPSVAQKRLVGGGLLHWG